MGNAPAAAAAVVAAETRGVNGIGGRTIAAGGGEGGGVGVDCGGGGV